MIETEDKLTAIEKMPARTVSVDLAIVEKPVIIRTIVSFDPDYLYAELNDEKDPKNRGNVFGRIIRNLAAKAGDRDATPKTKDPTFVRLLDQGIVVFNTLTGGDNQLEKTYNDKGELVHYRFEGETLGWSRDYAAQAK